MPERRDRWDADAYTRKFSFVPEYGAALLDLIGKPPGSRCLDLGCGAGALSAELHGRGFVVTGLDASPELLAKARTACPEVRFLEADAGAFTLPEPVDVVFSNAVLHWIAAERQPAVLDCVFRALAPGGEFVFEFGGRGNNARIHEALAASFAARGLPYANPFYFPSIGEYAPLVEAAGFRLEYAALFERPTVLQGPDGMSDWMAMFIRRPFAGLDAAVRTALIADAVSRLRGELFHDGTWRADYVRLRGKAVKRI